MFCIAAIAYAQGALVRNLARQCSCLYRCGTCHLPVSTHVGRILSLNPRGGLTCPTCRVPHAFSGAASVLAVPRNFALVSSLERLQQRGAAGGMLALESLQIGSALPSVSSSTPVHSGVLNLHSRQFQVSYNIVKPFHFTLLASFLAALGHLGLKPSLCNTAH